MSKTITLQAGNSDNSLSQQQWHMFVLDLTQTIKTWSNQVHFMGGPPNNSEYQNYCWVFDIDLSDWEEKEFIGLLKDCRIEYSQKSVAYTEGKTLFI